MTLTEVGYSEIMQFADKFLCLCQRIIYNLVFKGSKIKRARSNLLIIHHANASFAKEMSTFQMMRDSFPAIKIKVAVLTNIHYNQMK
jgi:hypothetical protein